MSKEIEFNKCVEKEIKQSVWKDAQAIIKEAQGLIRASWECLLWLLKAGIATVVTVTAVITLTYIFWMLLGNIVVTTISSVACWIGLHYFMAGIGILGVGVLALLLGAGLIYYSCKMEDAIGECQKRWQEHSLEVEALKLTSLKAIKNHAFEAGIIILIIAFLVIILGGLIANCEITIIVCCIMFMLLFLCALILSSTVCWDI
jgi:hypothetical protein